MVATIDALSAAIVGLYAWVRAVHYYVRPWWSLPTTIEAQKQVFNRGYRFIRVNLQPASHTPYPWYNNYLMFTGIPDGSIVEGPDHKLGLSNHPALTYTPGMPCVIDSAPPQGVQIRPREPGLKFKTGSEPASIQEQRRRIEEALSRRGEQWKPLSANCQQFTSSVVTGVPQSPALQKAVVLLFIGSCVAALFLFAGPPRS